MRKTIRKDKVMNQEQIINFFKAFDNPLFQDFALIQFFCAGRFGGILGIQLKNKKIPTLLQSEAVKKVGTELANSWERLGQLPIIKN